MSRLAQRLRRLAVLATLMILLPLATLQTAHALTADEALAMSTGETDARAAAIQAAAVSGNDQTRRFLRALADEQVRLADGRVVWVVEAGYQDPVTLESFPANLPVEDVLLNNRLRGEIDSALAALRLASPDAAVRADAALEMLRGPTLEALPAIRRALAVEKDFTARERLGEAEAAASLLSPDDAERLAAAQRLAESRQPEVLPLLNQALAGEQSAAVRQALVRAIDAVDSTLAWGDRLGVVFTGISLGSILLLAALGLAITYGLMGVINMAHGELIMLGAYATYLVQLAFRQWLPEGVFGAYLLVAIPASFLVSALIGAALEKTVLRHLYGRPLETLLATWGISLILMQAVRTLFGAQNVSVENPAWMSGGLQLLPNLSLPYNRLAIIVFAVLVLMGVALLISRTRLGLFVRGVTQNRRMASCVGVNTGQVDTYAFSLGCGIAGLAGCALSQVGNVGPDLGQAYIVDSFMVVVLGGVGQLIGTVYAALGLGLANKFLEGWAGAVLAKIFVLVFIIVFIQKRPQGLFAMKGRSAEA